MLYHQLGSTSLFLFSLLQLLYKPHSSVIALLLLTNISHRFLRIWGCFFFFAVRLLSKHLVLFTKLSFMFRRISACTGKATLSSSLASDISTLSWCLWKYWKQVCRLKQLIILLSNFSFFFWSICYLFVCIWGQQLYSSPLFGNWTPWSWPCSK